MTYLPALPSSTSSSARSLTVAYVLITLKPFLVDLNLCLIQIVWEVDPNRSYTTGSSGSETSVSTFNGQRSSSSSSSSRLSSSSSRSSSSSSRSSSSASSSSSSRASSSSSSSSAQPSASGTVSATFSEQATTYFGENIYLVGSISALGTWNTNNAVSINSLLCTTSEL